MLDITHIWRQGLALPAGPNSADFYLSAETESNLIKAVYN
jgi:hypothetical protein